MNAILRTHRTVRLSGALAERYGAEWSFSIESTRLPGDVLLAIDANAPGFLGEVLGDERRGVARRFVARGRELAADELDAPLGACDLDLVEVPVAGTGLEYVLLAISLAMAVASVVMAVLAKPPKQEEKTDADGYAFGGVNHEIAPGDAVPIAYGTVLCGTARTSLSIDADGWGSRTQLAHMVDLISEGPIEGWATPNPLDSIWLDETPARNFRSVSASLALGTQNQLPFGGPFEKSATTVSVGVSMTRGVPITREIAGVRTRSVRLNFGITSLMKQSDEGPEESNLNWGAKLLDANGRVLDSGSWPVRELIMGRRNYTVTLTAADFDAPRPWTVTAEKFTDDSSTKKQNDITFDSFTEIGDYTYSHPWTARVALRVTAEDFQSLPSAQYRVKGRKVRVPSNYNPTTRTYTGRWDGTFKAEEEWTDNPVWCWLDLATHWRYGLGEWIDLSDFNVWGLYRVARYCDAVDAAGNFVGVPDGDGGVEPRYTLNIQLRDRDEAWRVLIDLASAFAAVPFGGGAAVELVQDAPTTPVFHFHPENIVGGADAIVYSTIPATERVNRVVVKFKDPENFWRVGTAVATNTAAIALVGTVEKTWVAPGCESRGQAKRHANRLRSQFSSGARLCRFPTGMHGAPIAPGRAIWLTDPYRNAKRIAGLVRQTENSTTILLDREVTYEAGKQYEIELYQRPIAEEIAGTDDDDALDLAQSISGGTFEAVRVWMTQDGGATWVRRTPNGWEEANNRLRLVPMAGEGDAAVYRVEYRPAVLRLARSTTAAAVSDRFVTPHLFPLRVAPETAFVVTERNETPTLWKVSAVEENDSGTQWEIACVGYDPLRYDEIDDDVYFEPPPLTPSLPIGAAPLPPQGLQLEVVVAPIGEQATAKPVIRVRWSEPSAALDGARDLAGYRITYQRMGDEPTPVPFLVRATHYDLDVPWGIYQVTVASERLHDQRLSRGVTATIDFGADDLPRFAARIVRLEIEGRPFGDYTWEGREFVLQAGVASDDLPALDLDGPLTDAIDPYIQDYLWRFYHPVEGTLLCEPIATRERRLRVTWDMQTYSFRGGPYDTLIVECAPRDFGGREGTALRARFRNPPGRAPIVTVTETYDGFLLNLGGLDRSTDVRNVRVWFAPWSGGLPNKPPAGTAWKDAPLDETVFLAEQFAGQQHALWVALLDTFGDGVARLDVVGPLGPYETRETVTDGQITALKLADNAVLPQHVRVWLLRSSGTSFPVSPSAGDWFFRTDEDKVYQRNDANSAWVEKPIPENGLGLPVEVISDAYILRLNVTKLYGGTIAADLIGARTIGVEKLIVGDFQNYVIDPVFDLVKKGVALTTAWAINDSSSMSAIAGPENGFSPKSGGRMFRFNTAGNATARFVLGPPDNIPVAEGDKFTCEVSLGSSVSLTNAPLGACILFLDASLSTVSIAQAALSLTAGQWTTHILDSIPVPANARYARAGLRIGASVGGGAVIYCDKVIFRRSLGQAFIDEVNANSIVTGRMQATTEIEVGNNLVLSGPEEALVVVDNTTQERVRIGKDAGGQYGIEVRKANGDLIFNADGLGVYIVGTGNISPDAIRRQQQFTDLGEVYVSDATGGRTLATCVLAYTGAGAVHLDYQAQSYRDIYPLTVPGRQTFGINFTLSCTVSGVSRVVRRWSYVWSTTGGDTFSPPEFLLGLRAVDFQSSGPQTRTYSLVATMNAGRVTMGSRYMLAVEPLR